MEESLDTDIPSNTSELPRIKSSELMDFSGEKMTALSDAQALLDSVSKFYLDPTIYGENDYVEFKKKIDSTNLSAMMFQLKSAQHAITKLLEEIDLGNMHPRLFEVLAQLQSQIMQMPKDYQQYLEKMEQNYKKIQMDIEEKRTSGGILMESSENSESTFNANPNSVSSSGIKSRGTRGIMEGLRDILGAEVVDVKPIEVVNPNAIVNAKDKKAMDSQNSNFSQDDENEDGGFIIEDEILQ
jgi:predicted component of viral defense system (DUF524 family)